jgi:excisionase family DNA binding protein
MTNTEKETKGSKQEWFTLSEAAEYLRVSRQTIYNYINQGLLPYYELKSGGGRRIKKSDLDALLTKPSNE